MPTKPKPACRVCRRLNCTDPAHQPQPRQRTERRLERPDRRSAQETKRRRETVAAWLAEHGRECANGDVIARCPDCREMRARFVADHVHPLALGGSEDGELRVHCWRCSASQGATISNRVRHRGGS